MRKHTQDEAFLNLAAHAHAARGRNSDYQIFVRKIFVNDTLVTAHWDAGCDASIIPAAMAKSLAPIDPGKRHRVSFGDGVRRSDGTVSLRVTLTMRCACMHTFIVMEGAPMCLIGGDILQRFKACHLLRDREYHLYPTEGDLEVVHVDDPDMSPRKEATALFKALHAHMATVEEISDGTEDRDPDDALTQEALDARYGARIAAITSQYDSVFITDADSLSAMPPCPPQRPWDFSVKLINPQPPLHNIKLHNHGISHDPNDYVQRRFFERWTQGMLTSGAAPGAKYNNAIARCERAPFYVARATAIPKSDEKQNYTGDPANWDMRVVIDYRQVNKNTAVGSRTQCPSIPALLNSLAQNRYFSKMDLRFGFYNVGIANDFTRYCFAFSTPVGTFVPNNMPMGATQSPDYLMQMMYTIFAHLVERKVQFIYMDDMFIATRSVELHLEILQEILEISKEYSLSYKHSKCKFLQLSIEALGYKVSDHEISPGDRLTKVIENISPPTTKAAVLSFVATMNYYRPFIANFGRIAAPLTDMQRGTKPFVWGQEEHTAFLTLRDALLSRPVLRPFQPGLETISLHDASQIGGGAVLMQRADAEQPFHIVSFWSKRWPSTIAKNSVTELETRAIVEPIDGPWRHHLRWTPFTVYTDHIAATFLMTKDIGNCSVHDARSRTKLAEYPLLSIEHISGKHNEIADMLSRSITQFTEKILVVDAFAGCGTLIRALDQVLPWNWSIVYVAVEHDPECRQVITSMLETIAQTRPGRFQPHSSSQGGATFPFELGHDMNDVKVEDVTTMVRQYSRSLLTGGPPCQDFSQANDSPQGFQGHREGFTLMKRLIDQCGFTFWYVENVILREQDRTQVDDMFRTIAVELECADLGPARRRRLVWSNVTIPTPTEEDKILYGLSWQDCIHSEWKAPSEKAPCLMAATWSYSDRRGETRLRHAQTGLTRRMTPQERELLIGLIPGDLTRVITGADRFKTIWKMTGNAFPVPVQRHILHEVVRRFSISSGPDTTSIDNVDNFACQATNTTFHLDELRAAAGRDTAYVREMEQMTEDRTRFPHAEGGLIYTAEGTIQVPEGAILRMTIVDHYHEMLGHTGYAKIVKAVKADFYWKGMDKSIRDIVRSCPVCQQAKKGQLIATGLRSYPVDLGAWATIHMDITMIYKGLTDSEEINSALVVVDRFTRYSIVIPCKHALNTAQLFALMDQHVFAYFGMPRKIIADNGPPFNAVIWTDFIALMGVRGRHTTPYRPEENGLVERCNRTIKSILASVTQANKVNTPEGVMKFLPTVMWTINSTENATIGVSPYEALFGSPPYIPPLLRETISGQDVLQTYDETLRAKIKHMASVWKHITERSEEWNASLLNFREQPTWRPAIGDKVMLQQTRRNEALNLNEPEFLGPFPVVSVIGSQVLLADVPTTMGVSEVHVSRVKAWHDRPDANVTDDQGKWIYRQVLYRDFSEIAEKGYPSVRVSWADGSQTDELEQGDEGREYRANEKGMFLQKGITEVNADKVWLFQKEVMGIRCPILVNTYRIGQGLTRPAPRRKKIPPRSILLRLVVIMLEEGDLDNPVMGLVDDYDKDDPQAAWRVTWMDGQTTWVPYNFPADHPHGVAGKDFSVHLSSRLRKEHMESFCKGSSTGKRHRDAPLDCFRVSASQSDLEHVVPRWHPPKRQRSSCPHIIR